MDARPAGFPLLLDLRDREVLVVGGGAVALRRCDGLLAAGARVSVVAPEIGPVLASRPVRQSRRGYEPGDLDGAWLVMACTDDPAVNAAVAADAAERRMFCVRADDAGGGTARTPAVLRRDDLTVAVSGGDDPHRAVALVGGGPGDPELITVRGRRLVAEADVVVVDRLAPRALLAGLPEDVEIVDCGKAPHRHNLSQDEINAVLVDRARAGKRVVRLKGGDPFVFGRGGEEWLACVAAGIPVTVVPGLSSALAAPAVAGIPLTHRGVATDFTVVSGHLDPGRRVDGGVDWPGLATSGSTLVLLMAMDRLAAIAAALVAHGRSPHTPAAVVQRATLDGQRVLRAPLARLAERAVEEGIGAPAVVVIGEVVDVLG